MSSPAHLQGGGADSSSANQAQTKDDEHVELKDIGSSAPARLDVEDDIMQLARLGEISAIEKLIDSGKFESTYADEEGITPLHWAAINNHYALCHYLIQKGANINAKGGDAVATPILWAAKRCNYYVVHLLLQHGADPLITDDQGFNLLHSATLDGNVFQLVLLLHQDLPVDIPDSQGHTSLMWAAYKGFPACVDLFLRWGANVYARDDQGFTALHWALVKGSPGCIQKLIEYGSDRFAENNEHKTPSMTASEMNSSRQWRHALSECGFNADGSPKYFPFASIVKDRRVFISRTFFIWPLFILFSVIYILSHVVIYAAIPIALFTAWGMQWVAQKFLRWAPPDMKSIHKTPFLAGIFAGTLFWIGLTWATRILPATFTTHFFTNLLFGGCYSLCAYFYFSTMMQDPGFVPKAGSRSQQKAIIEELIEARRFDENSFCVKCMIRKPIRSKHCGRCGRCVAKEDHHCPWVDNCVANNNHRHFVFYVICVEIGIILYVWAVLYYLSELPSPQGVTCNILPKELCETVWKDPFVIVLAGWSIMQLVWVTMLLIVQLLQIARGLTTYESMKGYSHGHGPADTITSFVATGASSLEDAQVTNNSSEQTGARHQHQGAWDQWKRLLGLDTFMATALQSSNATNPRAQQRGNPFSRGLLTNCKDFWAAPGPIFGRPENGAALFDGERVDYTRIYEPPAQMTMRRVRQDGGNANYVSVNTEEDV